MTPFAIPITGPPSQAINQGVTRWSEPRDFGAIRRHPTASAAFPAPHSRTTFAGLVVPQAEEARVAQAAGARPFGEAELADELGLDPRRVAVAGRVGERRVVAAQGPQASPRSRSVARLKPVPTLPE